jgi:hypothetical protein
MPKFLKGNFETKRPVAAPQGNERTLKEQFLKLVAGMTRSLPDSAPSTVYALKGKPPGKRSVAAGSQVIQVLGRA